MGWRREYAKPLNDARQVFPAAVLAGLGPAESGLDEPYTIDEELEDWDRRRAVTVTLLTLTAREERVIRLLYGLSGPEMTLRQVADEFGVSVERIRQIEGKALRKLKHPRRTAVLAGYGDGRRLKPLWRPRPAPTRHMIEVNGNLIAVRIKRRLRGGEREQKMTGLPGPYVLFDFAGQEWLASESELRGTA